MAAKFGELYHYCQTLKPKISRSDIKKKVIELTGAQVRAIIVSLDTKVCRGFFVSAKNTEHPFVKKSGINTIVLARGLDAQWERFVYTKELMHVFDETHELTSNPQLFEKLLIDFGQPSVEISPQTSAEAKAFWMALACLCPEKARRDYQAQLEKKATDHYSIAVQLQIPELVVGALFAPVCEPNIQQLIK